MTTSSPILDKVNVYIISWSGLYDKALKTANDLIQHTSLIETFAPTMMLPLYINLRRLTRLCEATKSSL